jgi:hypothetical protein
MTSPAPADRIFTVEQADRMLPLVSRIVRDVVTHYAKWHELLATCEGLLASNAAESRDQAALMQEEIQRAAGDIDRFLAELAGLGVQFKGFEDGLIDFPARIDGEDVLLCWKLGEPAVEYWHYADAGFAGRQRVRP